MAKYIFGILACAFLALGFTHISNKELQGFQKETGVPAIDMSYNEGANCCISSAGFDKSCKETHSLLTVFLIISLFQEALFLSRI